MQYAIEQAQLAFRANEVPVGAVVVREGRIIAASGNNVRNACDPTGHAEIRVLRQACLLLKTTWLIDCDLHVTLEPCPMCAQAIALTHIRHLYFGAYDPKGGGIEHGPRLFSLPCCHHHPEVFGGIEEEACAELLTRFFAEKRSAE
ncbi:MAG: nucleoside deaminase [Holosporales bacterium]|nr:nucleoside deaminase [Holosporales bacterium]